MMLFKKIRQNIEENKTVKLDFTGSLGMPTSYLNGFLGEAFDKYGIDRVREVIKFSRLTKVQADSIRKYAADMKEMRGQAE